MTRSASLASAAIALMLATTPAVHAAVVLSYCGYIGGDRENDGSTGVAVDALGSAYVSGYGPSTQPTFPVRVGPDTTYNGGVNDAWVVKVKTDGTGLVYAGYIGGDGDDQAGSIAVDATGAAYIGGETASSEATFPVLSGPALVHKGGPPFQLDAFVAKVKPGGTGLVYCGYIGGDGDDRGAFVALDTASNLHVTGTTDSTAATFPVAIGPDLTFNGVFDAFVAKVKPNGTGLVYAGYLGGSGEDWGQEIAVDAAGSPYVTGPASSASFPVQVGPDLTYNGGMFDAYVAKVKADGTGLVYAGFIGGNARDVPYGLAVDPAGRLHVAGSTQSGEATFPVIVGPDLSYNAGGDAFVARVAANGKSLDYAGYIGGFKVEEAERIALDADGNDYLAGYTWSDETTFPVRVGPDLSFSGRSDAFVARVAAGGAGLDYAGYIGGSGYEGGSGIAVDATGAVYFTGSTDSDQATFPVVVGPDLTFNGLADSFVAKIGALACPDLAAPIQGLQAVKAGASLDDIDFTWQPDPPARGYNLWYVLSAPKIDQARLGSLDAIGVGLCSVPAQAPGPACTDVGAVSRTAGTPFYYQARTYCDLSTEGP